MDPLALNDYYDVLQISPNAEPEIIRRVYRILAQRYHPDNPETGNCDVFRRIAEAYRVLSDPERRAAYDVLHREARRLRGRVSTNPMQPRASGPISGSGRESWRCPA